jgi:hypothetical protein
VVAMGRHCPNLGGLRTMTALADGGCFPGALSSCLVPMLLPVHASRRREVPASDRRQERARSRAGRSQLVQLRRFAGYAGGACFPREAGKLLTGVTMRALPGKASVRKADPLTRHGSA